MVDIKKGSVWINERRSGSSRLGHVLQMTKKDHDVCSYKLVFGRDDQQPSKYMKQSRTCTRDRTYGPRSSAVISVYLEQQGQVSCT